MYSLNSHPASALSWYLVPLANVSISRGPSTRENSEMTEEPSSVSNASKAQEKLQIQRKYQNYLNSDLQQ